MSHPSGWRKHALRAVALALTAPWIGFAVLRVLALDAGDPLVSLIAFTPYAALTAAVPVVGALLLRRWWIAGLGALAAVLLIATVLPRALANEPAAGLDDGRTLTVMSVNMYVGRADVAQILRIAKANRVDVLSLQELKRDALVRLDSAGAKRLFPRRAIALRAAGGGSGLLLGRRLRVRRVADAAGSEQPAASVIGPAGRPIAIEAIHPPPPLSDSAAREWRSQLRALPAAGEGTPLRILAGDFNATLDHHEIRKLLDRGYLDAADVTGAGLKPTWRSPPKGLPIAIDHVLVDRRATARSFSTHDIRGTDHEAILTELVIPRH